MQVAAADVVEWGAGKAVSRFLAAACHQRLEGLPGDLRVPAPQRRDLPLGRSRQADVDARVRLTGSNSSRDA